MTFSGKWTECGLGEVQVVQKGAMRRTEGGGIVEKEIWPGTTKIAGALADASTTRIAYGPRTIVLNNIPVNMVSMKNQELKFTMALTYMKNPHGVVKITTNFRSSTHEIERLFKQSCIRVLSKLDMGLDLDALEGKKVAHQKGVYDKSETLVDFSDRSVVAQVIMNDFKKSFELQHPAFAKDFIFIAVDVGDVNFNPTIITAMEKAVARMYKNDVLLVEKELQDIMADIAVAKSNADAAAYKVEAGAMNDDVISYFGLGLLEKIQAL